MRGPLCLESVGQAPIGVRLNPAGIQQNVPFFARFGEKTEKTRKKPVETP
jgi:hypothetical protein